MNLEMWVLLAAKHRKVIMLNWAKETALSLLIDSDNLHISSYFKSSVLKW